MTQSTNARLVFGGVRSGKSRFAKEATENLNKRRTVIATAEALDAEMEYRIAKHKSDRDESWHLVEAPLHLSAAIRSLNNGESAVLVDCLTLWLSNIMHAGLDLETETAELLASIKASNSSLIIVSNEVGMGVVPNSPLGREFRDAQGRLNQLVAGVCSQVDFMLAGIALRIKG